MKLILTTMLIVACYCANAQVGIGTTSPNPSSILDISSSNKGVLLPQVSLSSTSDNSTISSPASGLIVYNLSTTGDVTPGYYFWGGSSWNKFNTGTSGGGSGSGWNLTGNSLSTGNEFLGTTNWAPLRFRVNSSDMGQLHPNGGIRFGSGSSTNNNHSIAIGTNSNSSASNQAVAIGYGTTASGYQSIGLGYNAVSSNNGATAVGINSSASGQNSTAIGASTTASGQSAVAIGNGAFANNPNTIILGNTTSDSDWAGTKIGLGTSSPSVRLDVAGRVKIVDGTQGVDKVLTSDATGQASWVDQKSQKVFAEMYKSTSGATQTVSSSTPVTFGTTGVSQGVTVNNNNFQVTEAGTYRISYAVSVVKSGGGTVNIGFVLATGWGSGNRIAGTFTHTQIEDGGNSVCSLSKIVHLNAYQQVYLFPDITNSNIQIMQDSANMNIELIRRD